MVYQDQVAAAAARNNLDPAWLYGIMRQESAFMHDARSSAGAMGLMQLMPSTASLTARLIKSPLRNNLELYDVDRNIELGSAYLKQMSDQHNGNQVLATAAYNAGPHRVKQWIPTAEQAADVWIELIPFRETREYVKRVLTYSTIFDDRLQGAPRRITTRMPLVPSKTP
jgi:soluble lytic murein transglycosylase